MKLILRSDVNGLGKAFEVVNVKEGYARNYLLPKNLAVKATEQALKQINADKKRRQAKLDKDKQALLEKAKSLQGKSFNIPVVTNEEDKPYASISSKDIAQALKAEGLEIEAQQVDLPEPIKELGIFEAGIDLGQGVKTRVKVWVVKK